MISKTELQTLAEQRGKTSVSLYMPTVKAASEIQQNPIRLKNLLDEAESQLREAGLDAPEIDALLQPVQQIIQDEVFWQQQSDGLALFLAPNFSRAYRLPLDFESLVVVTDHFHLKPLFPLLSHDGQFYILALSQKNVRLFQGSHYSVSEVNVEDVPESVYELLDYDEMERHVQFHTRTQTPSSKSPGTTPSSPDVTGSDRPGAFHGQSVAEEDEKQDIKKYFRRIDEALETFLEDGNRPLVLAGVDYLLPIYREANSYPHLAEGEIVGSPKTWDAEELHNRAWEIVEPIFADKESELRRRYKELKANAPSRTSQDIEEIVPAAYFERVDTLFLDKDAHRWGTFDPETNDVLEHDEQQAGDEDLLDLAAIHTFLNNGQLFSVPSASMPDNTSIAAIFRF
jgi:hypothetical protein